MREHRLYRSREDRMLFGVAGGMAEWMDLDPAVVRIVWALLVLAGGVGVLLYIVAAIVMPEAPFTPTYPAEGAAGEGTTAATGTAEQAQWEAGRGRRAARRGSGNAPMIFGVVLVIAGAWFLIERYVPAIDTSWFIPGVLIVVGVALVLGAMGRSRNADGG